MKFVIADARANRTSLVDAANSLLFLRNAMEELERSWSDRFTSHIVTLESAATATAEQRVAMGPAYGALIASTLEELDKIVASIDSGDGDSD